MDKGKVAILSVLMTFILFQWAGSLLAVNSESTRETLRGLSGVEVRVEPLKWIIEQKGLTTAQLRNDTELRLRLAGIRVMSSEESLDAPGKPVLYVNPRVIKQGSKDKYIFNIRVELTQRVALARVPEVKTTVPTWSLSVTGISPELSTVREQVKELLDVFINAYLSVNPE